MLSPEKRLKYLKAERDFLMESIQAEMNWIEKLKEFRDRATDEELKQLHNETLANSEEYLLELRRKLKEVRNGTYEKENLARL